MMHFDPMYKLCTCIWDPRGPGIVHALCANLTGFASSARHQSTSYFLKKHLDEMTTSNPVITEATVGLEKTFYQVSESEGVVEVCATVSRPNGNLTCPISFQFDVSLSTGDNSAGIRHCSAVCLHNACNTTLILLQLLPWTILPCPPS